MCKFLMRRVQMHIGLLEGRVGRSATLEAPVEFSSFVRG